MAVDYFFGIDPISYMTDKTIEYGQTVHHIVPVEKDPSRQFDFDNLILITESRHRQIHKLMETEPDKVIAEITAERKRFSELFHSAGGT